jgi:hypothetical protein
VLDPYQCSQYDDCSVIHSFDGAVLGGFEQCIPEPEEPGAIGCYEGDVCGAGLSCNASEVCLAPPGCGTSDGLQEPISCDTCYGYCVPDVQNPGSCVGEVGCRADPPDCPYNSVPGIDNMCWTGYCIPLSQCDTVPSCEGQTEAQCLNRGDCEPIYQGVGCSCDDMGCTCDQWVYDECQVALDNQS